MTKRIISALRLWLALAMAACAPIAASAAPPRDWSQTATRKPDGAFVQGNPDAKVKLVEYLSLTCPHCAKFEEEAIAPLTAKYIRTGLVSYEVRHALRDAFDFTATMLARCNGPAAFFRVAPDVYAHQLEWLTAASAWSRTIPDEERPLGTLLPMAAQGAGLDTFFAARGLPLAKGKTCLTDESEQKLLTAMANEAWHRPSFPGTPAFVIDGALYPDIQSWADLDKRLAASIH